MMSLSLPDPVSAVSAMLPAPVSAVSSSSGNSKLNNSNSDRVSNNRTRTVTAAVISAATCAVDPGKLFPAEHDSVLMKHLDNANEAVIGLEYLLEIREDGYRSNPSVICLLCSHESMASQFMNHVYSPSHRLRYHQHHY